MAKWEWDTMIETPNVLRGPNLVAKRHEMIGMRKRMEVGGRRTRTGDRVTGAERGQRKLMDGQSEAWMRMAK
ncbi:uncharacterized protein G2W53_003647 [Senna tora]|uniref:Uncharacterized protein n=1 Tax=Senna tora TaxID=362788 RepID=A0A835CGK7_9FABA|nr:uncharacterized protein G2W53_003647 [Senna tora]